MVNDFEAIPGITRFKIAEVGLYEKGDQAPRRTVMVIAENSFEAILKKLRDVNFPLHGCDGFRVMSYKELLACQDIPRGLYQPAKIELVNICVVNNKARMRIPAIISDDMTLKRRSDDPASSDFKRCLTVQDTIAYREMGLLNIHSKWIKVPDGAENKCEAYLERVKPVMAVIE